ncbi:hypothetical protein GW864_04330 [bacterium]|nr:hypothetical protein [bacterium]
MAKVFLDTNYFIDIIERDKTKRSLLEKNEVYVSPLSYHIYSYVAKKKVPNQLLIHSLKDLIFIDLSIKILSKSLEGPTPDLEDNIQLHSASSADCDYFLTSDKQLLKMKYFGQVEIVSSL